MSHTPRARINPPTSPLGTIIRRRHPQGGLLKEVTTILILSISSTFYIRQFRPLIQGHDPMFRQPSAQGPLIRHRTYSRLINFRDHFTPVARAIIFGFYFLAILRMNVMNRRQKTRVVVPAQFRPRKYHDVTPTRPIFYIVFLILRIIITKVSSRQGHVVSIGIMDRFPHRIMRTMTSDIVSSYGRHFKGRMAY